jgi:hypothetical protein
VAIRTPPRTALPPLTSCQWREGRRCQKCEHSPNSAACECRWNRTGFRKACCNASAASASDIRKPNCGYAPRCVACGGSHLSGGCSTQREQPQCCGCGGNHTANYCGCTEWKKAKAAIAEQATQPGRKNAATGHPAAPKAERVGPSAEQMDLG